MLFQPEAILSKKLLSYFSNSSDVHKICIMNELTVQNKNKEIIRDVSFPIVESPRYEEANFGRLPLVAQASIAEIFQTPLSI